MPEPQGARIPAPRVHPPHAPKAMSNQQMIPDGLSDLLDLSDAGLFRFRSEGVDVIRLTLLPYYPTALIPSCPIAGKPSSPSSQAQIAWVLRIILRSEGNAVLRLLQDDWGHIRGC